MKKSFQIGAAFIGVIVGAGFASGQEILQFFTSFGIPGVIGSFIAMILFAFLGMNLTALGSRLQTTSHQTVIYHICGRYIGVVVDFFMTFFLFGVTVVMFSGAGAIFEQQFNIPSYIGSITMAILTIISVTLSVQKVITLISAFTPLLFVIVIVIMIYSVFNFEFSADMIEAASATTPKGANNWILGAVLYVSYNIAAGAAMLTVMGGTVKDEKVAAWGGIIGGIGLGLIILFINIAMLTKLQDIADAPMPMLILAESMHPVVAVLMSIILLAMIYNTAVGMLYAFAARLVKPETPKFKLTVIGSGIIAYAVSFVGFVTLVGTVYPTMGYLGFILMGAIIFTWFTKRKKTTTV